MPIKILLDLSAISGARGSAPTCRRRRIACHLFFIAWLVLCVCGLLGTRNTTALLNWNNCHNYVNVLSRRLCAFVWFALLSYMYLCMYVAAMLPNNVAVTVWRQENASPLQNVRVVTFRFSADLTLLLYAIAVVIVCIHTYVCDGVCVIVYNCIFIFAVCIHYGQSNLTLSVIVCY